MHSTLVAKYISYRHYLENYQIQQNIVDCKCVEGLRFTIFYARNVLLRFCGLSVEHGLRISTFSADLRWRVGVV